MITQTMVQQNYSPEFWSSTEITYRPRQYYFKGGGGGGESAPASTTTVQKSEPWASQIPFLERGFHEAVRATFESPMPEFFPGNTVVPLSDESKAALNMQTTRALAGSPVQSAANQQLMDTLGGNYLYGGDGFNAALDAATRKIMPQIDSAFARAGRTGSGLAQTAKTQAIADAFAGQYGQERENQLRGMLFAPQMLAQDYVDIAKLAEVGTARESFSQEQLADQMARHNFDQTKRLGRLQDYMNIIQGNYGGSSFASTAGSMPTSGGGGGRSSIGGALSGAAGGAMAGTAIMPGWGTAIGAGVGLLSGLL